MKKILQLTLFLGSILVGLMNAQSITYSTFEVPEAAPEGLSIQGINNSGVTDGYLTDTSGNLKGFVRNAKGDINLLVDPLDTTTPTATVAYGLNNGNTVVGYFFDTADSLYYGYFLNTGTYSTYIVPNQPAGTDISVGGINNSGSFCGIVLQPPYTTYQIFVSLNGVVTVFQVEGSDNENCFGINDSGTAVGFYTDSAGVEHGWMRTSSGNITLINVPAASTTAGTAPCAGTVGGSSPAGINNQGFITGHYWDKKFNEHGFIRTPAGKYLTLNVPGAYQTAGGGISNKNQMVGHWAVDSSCNEQGFIATINQ